MAFAIKWLGPSNEILFHMTQNKTVGNAYEREGKNHKHTLDQTCL